MECIHTLRYYEQERLIKPRRNSANRRCYTEQDLTWFSFIKRLKDTGMPIKEIRHYAQMREKGDTTLKPRMELLISHQKSLKEQINQLQEHMDKLENKINYYHEEIKKL